MTDPAPWPSGWLRATLSLLVLRVLSGGPTYGYAIAAELERAGIGTIKGGTLYPLLGRLEDDGLISSRWEPGDGGPGRKYFVLTRAGELHLHSERRRWQDFSTLVGDLLDEPAHEEDTP